MECSGMKNFLAFYLRPGQMQSSFKEIHSRRAEARNNADLQKERRRSDVEQKTALKSQKLDNMTADRQKLWEIRKTAHREAERILRDAKREVHRQSMSSRYSVKFIQEQMGRLENPEGITASVTGSSPGSSSASLQDEVQETRCPGGFCIREAFRLKPQPFRHMGLLLSKQGSESLSQTPFLDLWPGKTYFGIAQTKVLMAPVDGKVSLSLCQMLESEKKAAAAALKAGTDDEEHTAPPKKSFQPYHAQSVPKSEDLEAVAFSRQNSGEVGDVTTMMLRNIPNKYTQNSLLQEINDLGFAGTFDFFYLPMDVHNRSNVGYAFINFLRPDDAELFRHKFSDHRFQRFQSRKISSVCTAHVQGLHENLRHFQNRAVTHARNDQYRPVVFRNGSRVDIEDIMAEGKSSGSEDEKPRAAKKEERKTKGKAEPKRAPTTSKTTPSKNGRKGQEGLEEAIRQSLEALQERMAHENQESPLSPPPGLTPPFEPAVEQPVQMGQEQEVMQLLNLRGLLLDRLLHKEENFAYNQAAAFLAMQQLQEQQYMQMQSPAMCPMPYPQDAEWEDPAYVDEPLDAKGLQPVRDRDANPSHQPAADGEFSWTFLGAKTGPQIAHSIFVDGKQMAVVKLPKRYILDLLL
eukprot:symbB.v1.2.039238.t1/scaffold6433.1/size18149/2